MKKKLVLFLLLGLTSIGISSCSKKDYIPEITISDKTTEIRGGTIPDGIYFSSINAFELELTYIDNKLTKRIVNGEEVDISLNPKQIIIIGEGNESNAMDYSMEIYRKNQCVSLSRLDSKSTEQEMWLIEYDTITPCWWDK
ncbi:MAG: hypothetical protein WC135_06095 [Bacteroidales bacterium]